MRQALALAVLPAADQRLRALLESGQPASGARLTPPVIAVVAFLATCTVMAFA